MRRSKSRKKTRADRPATTEAVALGTTIADRVLREQRTARRMQTAVAEKADKPSTTRRRNTPMIRPEAARELARVKSVGTLMAEGDSWFDYPKGDVLDMLRKYHGFDIESVAHHGDRIEDMAFAEGSKQLHRFIERLEKLLQQNIVPRAVLLSGGGNDIAGDEFEMLLNHNGAPKSGFNDRVVAGVIDERIRNSYVMVISEITEVITHYLTSPLPILVHGYDYPVPDGRGFLSGIGPLPGPWLRPGFHRKGFKSQTQNTDMMQELILRFNRMVASLHTDFVHVRYVDLQNTLSNSQGTFERDWDNELHPTDDGFKKIAAKFAAAVP